MAAVVLEDFWKPFFKELSQAQIQFLVRAVVIIVGLICIGRVIICTSILILLNIYTEIWIKKYFIGLVFVVEKLGSVLQLTMSLTSATIGPQLGVFVMGIFMPFIDSTVRITFICYINMYLL